MYAEKSQPARKCPFSGVNHPLMRLIWTNVYIILFNHYAPPPKKKNGDTY